MNFRKSMIILIMINLCKSNAVHKSKLQNISYIILITIKIFLCFFYKLRYLKKRQIIGNKYLLWNSETDSINSINKYLPTLKFDFLPPIRFKLYGIGLLHDVLICYISDSILAIMWMIFLSSIFSWLGSDIS